MNVPTVQVPVSLLARVLVNDDAIDAGQAESELLRLIDEQVSQPTPTAEHKPDCDRASELSTYCDCHVGKAVLHGPESPQIEDIASGTITSICPRCGGSGCVGLADCRLCAGTGVVSNPVPSTIRDVTLPKDAS